MEMNEAIVLAGGLGTRLRPITNEIPKPMAPIADKPFLYYILNWLKCSKINRVILAVSYKWQVIYDYFGTNFSGLKLDYSIENSPLGTGGAIKKALNFSQNSRVAIINGDTFLNVALPELFAEAAKKDADILMTVRFVDNTQRYGKITFDQNMRITKFSNNDSQEKSGYINAGVYIIRKNLFDRFNLPENFSFEKFILENVDNLKIYAYISNDYFIDIGVPEDYLKAQEELIKYAKGSIC